jgi:hypothetical protein
MTRKSHLLAAPLMLFFALAAFSQTPAARIATGKERGLVSGVNAH